MVFYRFSFFFIFLGSHPQVLSNFLTDADDFLNDLFYCCILEFHYIFEKSSSIYELLSFFTHFRACFCLLVFFKKVILLDAPSAFWFYQKSFSWKFVWVCHFSLDYFKKIKFDIKYLFDIKSMSLVIPIKTFCFYITKSLISNL